MDAAEIEAYNPLSAATSTRAPGPAHLTLPPLSPTPPPPPPPIIGYSASVYFALKRAVAGAERAPVASVAIIVSS